MLAAWPWGAFFLSGLDRALGAGLDELTHVRHVERRRHVAGTPVSLLSGLLRALCGRPGRSAGRLGPEPNPDSGQLYILSASQAAGGQGQCQGDVLKLTSCVVMIVLNLGIQLFHSAVIVFVSCWGNCHIQVLRAVGFADCPFSAFW